MVEVSEKFSLHPIVWNATVFGSVLIFYHFYLVLKIKKNDESKFHSIGITMTNKHKTWHKEEILLI